MAAQSRPPKVGSKWFSLTVRQTTSKVSRLSAAASAGAALAGSGRAASAAGVCAAAACAATHRRTAAARSFIIKVRAPSRLAPAQRGSCLYARPRVLFSGPRPALMRGALRDKVAAGEKAFKDEPDDSLRRQRCARAHGRVRAGGVEPAE